VHRRAAFNGLGVLLTVVTGRRAANAEKGDQFLPEMRAALNGEPS